jgi:polar amino acid transport system substrate-binding protein
MRKKFFGFLTAAFIIFMFIAPFATASDIELAKKSTLEKILKRGELIIGTESGYPPFEMTDKKGKIVGFDIDLAKEMAKAMGVKLKIVNTAFDGIIPALTTEKFDIIISGITTTQERNLKINFSDPYMTVGQTVLLNDKHKDKITSYKQLNNEKYVITSKIGTTGEQAVKRYMPKAKYKSFEESGQAALEVAMGKADAVVYDLPFCATFIATQGKGLVFLDKPFTYEPLSFGIRKGDPDFLNWLNNFLVQLKNDGRYDKIYDRWFKNMNWTKNVD